MNPTARESMIAELRGEYKKLHERVLAAGGDPGGCQRREIAIVKELRRLGEEPTVLIEGQATERIKTLTGGEPMREPIAIAISNPHKGPPARWRRVTEAMWLASNPPGLAIVAGSDVAADRIEIDLAWPPDD